MVVGNGLRLSVVVGAGGALALGRLLRSLLYETAPTDPVTFVLVAAVLGTAALLSSVLPEGCAARLDPIAALRRE